MKVNGKFDEILNDAMSMMAAHVKTESKGYYEVISLVSKELQEKYQQLSVVDAGSIARQAILKLQTTGQSVVSSRQEGSQIRLYLNRPDRITGTQL